MSVHVLIGLLYDEIGRCPTSSEGRQQQRGRLERYLPVELEPRSHAVGRKLVKAWRLHAAQDNQKETKEALASETIKWCRIDPLYALTEIQSEEETKSVNTSTYSGKSCCADRLSYSTLRTYASIH